MVAPDGTRIDYIDLADATAKITLKPRSDWRFLGQSLPRTDMVAKSTGTARYTAALRFPGMLCVTAWTNPKLGGVLKGGDA